MCAAWPRTFGGDRVRAMSWKEWLEVSVPCGLVTSGDIGLSNLSLVTISITFYTMVKSSTPVFVLGWAYLFGIERITWALIGVVVIIAMGEFLTVMGEVDFQPLGFSLCLGASMLSGARWTLVQLKLQRLDPPLKTTITTMKLLAPSMFISMLLFSFAVERPWNKFGNFTIQDSFHIIGLGLVGALFAIAMILCEFHLIMYASAVILMIGGVIKEVITIFVGVMFFHDELNRINLAGCFVIFIGVVLYKITHHMNKQKQRAVAVPVSDDDDDDVDVSDSASKGRGGMNRGASNGTYRTVGSNDSGEDLAALMCDGDEGTSDGLQMAAGVVEQRRSSREALVDEVDGVDVKASPVL